MSYRNLDYLNKRRIIYRRSPLKDQPTESFDWGDYYEDGTYECYELFRSKAKITTYKSLKWHLLVLWYLNPQLNQDDFDNLSKYICNKETGFITFTINEQHLRNITYEVSMCDLEESPKNKIRKIIFKEYSGLTSKEKMSIVGSLVGRSKRVEETDIYQCMLELHDDNSVITINKLAKALKCSYRTIHRNMSNELKKEKELLNQQTNEKI
jgi:hypothetical protein|tara:strand:- start:1347 stop:1976 length:630 start_codon:yes stop_codon:yes gene_type:complete